MTISVAWTRIIRFKAQETGDIHLGEPVDTEVDVGLALKNGETVLAKELLASSILDISAVFGDRVLTVATLECPLRARADTVGIYCYGINYKAHAAEAKVAVGPNPASFIKPVTTLNGPWPSPIKVPTAGQDKGLDYEAELAVIIGKSARDVTEETALDHVLGYTSCNDVSTRMNQVNNVHWCLGKGLDSFCPIGPAVVSQQAIKDPASLYIEGCRNGVVKQKSQLSDMIWNVPYLIARASEGVTLEPGTIILTGTPAGVASGEQGADKWIKDGEEYSVFLSHGIGTLINRYEFE